MRPSWSDRLSVDRAGLPVVDGAGVVADCLDDRLYWFRAHRRFLHGARVAEVNDAEHVVETFEHPDGRVGVGLAEPGGQGTEIADGLVEVRVAPRLEEFGSHPGPLGFGQLVEHISLLLVLDRGGVLDENLDQPERLPDQPAGKPRFVWVDPLAGQEGQATLRA